MLGEVEEREVGGKGEEGGVGSEQVEEKTGEGDKKASEGKNSEQQAKDGGDSGKKGGEAGDDRGTWGEQVEEEEMEEEALKSKQTVKRRRSNRTILNDAKSNKVQMNSDVSESECVSDSSEVPLFNNSQRKKLLTVDKFQKINTVLK